MKFAYSELVRTLMFVITLTHSPELCPARNEFGISFKHWYGGMNDLAKKLNIGIHGAYSCPTEHTFYFILESSDYKAITEFFAGIMLTNHTGRISPVNTLKESANILIR
jgi:hypothetical protein